MVTPTTKIQPISNNISYNSKLSDTPKNREYPQERSVKKRPVAMTRIHVGDLNVPQELL